MGTSWISRKEGILEKGVWSKQGEYEPPYQLWVDNLNSRALLNPILLHKVFWRTPKSQRDISLFSNLEFQIIPDLGMLKVVSATFLLVCFISLKESTCETK